MTDSPFGRVAEDGTVYVLTSEGERIVGQWPDGDPRAAMDFYQKRYEGLAVEVDLLEQRIRAGALSPEEATNRVAQVRTSVQEAQAVGDLDALVTRLDSLKPLIDERREARKAERAARTEESRAAKERIADEAERLASGTDWRNGANRLRDLLEQWKTLPRIDKPSDDALWHRFSSARTTYTRRRKQHFAELNERREQARVAKEKLVVEAEALESSTEWGETTRAFRDLMAQWKAAGGAPKEVDDALWKRFRTAQDTFFTARDAANSKVNAEYARNAEVKRGLLERAEALLPVTDSKAALDSFRDIARQWDAAGKVPREDMKDLEGRFKRVEQAVRGAEDARWRRSSPEAQARAADTVAQLEQSLESLRKDLDSAVASGDHKAAADAEAAIETRQSWLDEARKALDEFTP